MGEKRAPPLVDFLLGSEVGLGDQGSNGVAMHRISLTPYIPTPLPLRLCNKGNFLESPTPSPPTLRGRPCMGGKGKQTEKTLLFEKVVPFKGNEALLSCTV